MDWIAIGLGLIIGIPAAALTYWYTKRNQKLYGSGFSGDYTSGGGGHSGGGGGGGDGSDSSS